MTPCVVRDDQPDAREGQAGRPAGTFAKKASSRSLALRPEHSRVTNSSISIAAPGSGDFTCESEGVTEIEREVGG